MFLLNYRSIKTAASSIVLKISGEGDLFIFIIGDEKR